MSCRCRDSTANPPDAQNPNPGVHTVRSETGFTVRELREVAERLRQAHRLCPYAQPHLHDEQGFVESGMTFEAPLHLKQNDPRMVTEWQMRAKDRAMEKETTARLGPYIAAKASGLVP